MSKGPGDEQGQSPVGFKWCSFFSDLFMFTLVKLLANTDLSIVNCI